MLNFKVTEQAFDVVVIGGGMAGISAAIAAARRGARTALVQDRPVLGGNASSEVRMHIVGATRHGARPNLRETGIIEEILLENKYRNPTHSYAMFDALLWEKVTAEPNLTLYLNTYACNTETEGRRLCAVFARQLTTEKSFRFTAPVFIDCSGDGMISAMAGASYMFGREAAETFGEPNAVKKADQITMGNSIQFKAVDEGRPVPFTRPAWAYDFSDCEWLREHVGAEITSGYWWLEVGGTEWNVVKDAELTRDEMLKILFGIWDFIKNHSREKKSAENLVLDWVAFLPAKRESRRITGDYVLTENDVLENRRFPDAVGYGGWHLDSHQPERFYSTIKDVPHTEDLAVAFEGIYTVPYRCIYAKDLDNLLLGGRIISTSHRAFSSTRVMATCAVLAEAAGVAAAIAVREGCAVRDVQSHMAELQQTLLRNGCYIPGVANADPDDLARAAAVTASSEAPEGAAANVINGWNRPVEQNSNMWISAPGDRQPALSLQLPQAAAIREVEITFDSNLSIEIMISLSKWHHVRQSEAVPDTLVKDFDLVFLKGGKEADRVPVRNNHQRNFRYAAPAARLCDTVAVEVKATNGCEAARICEVRLYA